jgi:NADPH:quinone reductase-like Zn-dependent oxidoreductase
MDLLTTFIVLFFIFVLYKLLIYYLSARKANLKNINLKNKTILITGASDGIGVTTAHELAKLGATIIFACRSSTKTIPVIEKIKKETGNLKVRISFENFTKSWNS